MSKRSQFKINQRVREGDEGKRRAQVHVLQTLTGALALKVADNLRTLVTEEIGHELDRRGYTQKTQECDPGSLANRQLIAASLEAERGDPISFIKEAPKGEGCPSEKVGEGEE